jgi:hypothetical protein
LLKTGEQEVGIATGGNVGQRQAEGNGEFRAIVEPDVGDQRPATVGAMERLAIEAILRPSASGPSDHCRPSCGPYIC